MVDRLWKLFSVGDSGPPWESDIALGRFSLVVRLVYGAVLFTVVATAHDWGVWVQQDLQNALWPIFWLEWVPLSVGVAIVAGWVLVTGFLCLWDHVPLWRRVFFFLGLLQLAALGITQGTTSHYWHACIWICGLFCLLPGAGSGEDEGALRRRVVFLVWAATALLLFFYSMAGASKLVAALVQGSAGDAHYFLPEALPRHIAFKLMQGKSPTLASFLLVHPKLCQWLMIGVFYLEISSFVVAFRPRLFRLWGLALLLLHLGTKLALSVFFVGHVLLVLVLLVCTPFSLEPVSLPEYVRQLPILGDLIRCWQRVGPSSSLANESPGGHERPTPGVDHLG